MIDLKHSCGWQGIVSGECPKCHQALVEIPESNADRISILIMKVVVLQEEINHLRTKVENLVQQASIKKAGDAA
jgi:hypothetical protein